MAEPEAARDPAQLLDHLTELRRTGARTRGQRQQRWSDRGKKFQPDPAHTSSAIQDFAADLMALYAIRESADFYESSFRQDRRAERLEGFMLGYCIASMLLILAGGLAVLVGGILWAANGSDFQAPAVALVAGGSGAAMAAAGAVKIVSRVRRYLDRLLVSRGRDETEG